MELPKPEPMTIQKSSGERRTPTTSAFRRERRPISRCQSEIDGMTVPGLIGWVCGATAETVAILMLLLFLAGCFGLLGLLVFGPETVAGATDENVFQRRLADGDGLNIAGEGFDHIGHEAVPLFAF